MSKYGSGDLNPQARALVPKKELASESTFDTLLRDTAAMARKEDIFANAGPYKAEVLRVWKEDEANISAGSFWSLFEDGVSGELIFVKARIPELHHYPLDPKDIKSIEMHPTFVCRESNMTPPTVGTIVWVDFEDRRNLTFPVYLGPVNSSNGQVPAELAAAPPKGTRESFLSPDLADALGLGQPRNYDVANLPSDIGSDDTVVNFSGPVPYKENRIRVFTFGTLPSNSPLLTSVPSNKSAGQKLHKLAASRLNALNAAWIKETGNSPLLVTSGWRKHRWGHDFELYKKKIIKEYKPKYPGLSDAQVFRKGSGLKAFMSPHETGLAVDFGNHGLTPKSETIPKQRKTEAFIWLKANAHLFGFTPFKAEPWHWECLLTRRSWKTGEEFVTDFNAPYPYAVRIEEISKTPYPQNVKDYKGRSFPVKGQKLATTNKVFASNKFV
jgi:hypothetical protein